MANLLPTKPPRLILNPRKLRYLLCAPPKWGKTTFATGAPNSLLLAFEAGYASAECPIVVVTEWDRSYKERAKGWLQDDAGIVYTSALEVLEELERANPYEFIVIDTVDMLVKMASDHCCAAAKVEHPSDGGDYGRGYDLLQTTPVRRFYNRLTRIGCGIAAITHVKERTERDKFGVERYRRETTLPSAIQSFVHTQSDVIMHGFFGRRRRGQIDRDRIVSFDGTNEVMAGTRLRQVHVPNKYIVAPPTSESLDLPWQQWENFFTNSPQAGKDAEASYAKLLEGLDDETTTATATATQQQKREEAKK
jgi:AAA domain